MKCFLLNHIRDNDKQANKLGQSLLLQILYYRRKIK